MIIPLASDKTKQDLQGAYTANFCSWDRLKDYLGLAAGIKHGERIVGVDVDESGVRIIIDSVVK